MASLFNIYTREIVVSVAVLCVFGLRLFDMDPEILLAVCFVVFCFYAVVLYASTFYATLDYHHYRIKQCILRLAFRRTAANYISIKDQVQAKTQYLVYYFSNIKLTQP